MRLVSVNYKHRCKFHPSVCLRKTVNVKFDYETEKAFFDRLKVFFISKSQCIDPEYFDFELN